MSRLAVCVSLGIVLLLAADHPLEGDKFLQKADEKFEQAVTRAQESYAKTAGDAFETRLKTYRSILAAATKSGDFDRATAVKERIAEIEAERGALGAGAADKKKAAKAKAPKDAVRFGNHAFLLIKDPATWHIARKRCEEQGGHLAILRTPEELEFGMDICKAGGIKSAWVGATDELAEGKWKWVDGSDAAITGSAIDNSGGVEHYAQVYVDVGFDDTNTQRRAYICEWVLRVC